MSSRARPPTRPEYRLKRSITLDPIFGSCSNIYKSLWRLFFLASQWNRYSTMIASGQARPSTRLEYLLKRSITLDQTVGSCSNFYGSLWRLFSLASQKVDTRSESVWSGHTTDQTRVPAQQVLTLDLIVGSCLKFYRSFQKLFSLESQWNRYSTSTASRRANPPTRPEYRSKGPQLLIRPWDRVQIFIGVAGGCLPWSRKEIETRRPSRLVEPDRRPDQSTCSNGVLSGQTTD